MNESNPGKKSLVPNHLLREERERRNWTHKDVAEMINLPNPRTVGRWERGISFPSPHYRRDLCRIFGKNAEELGLVKRKSGETAQPSVLSESSQKLGRIWKMQLNFTSFIGRKREVEAVCSLLRRSDIRLVTLLGAGGIGKTRLGMEIASEMRGDFADGMCFVSLTSTSDPTLVAPIIFQALEIQESGTQPIIEVVKNALRDKHFLLLLDNFEQVVTAAPLIEELLVACANVKVLVTSRAVLHLQAEHQFHIAPLPLPALNSPPDVETLAQNDSVTLFVDRAQSRLPTFQLTSHNARTVAEICVRLDGLPLAIELAAARIKLLSPQALLSRLSQKFELLKSDLQTVPEKQQTLYKTITWSFDLLDPQEQWLFRHLSIFVGGCTLEAAETLFSRTEQQTIDIINTLTSLLDKSLIQQVGQEDEEPRFVLLETVREYGLDLLHKQGELEPAYSAHAMYYLAFIERAEQYLKGAQQAEGLALIELEQENLRAALQWFIEQRETDCALRFCDIFGKFCGLRGYWTEEQRWLRAVLALPQMPEHLGVRARVLRRAGHLAYRLRDLASARALQEESILLSREQGDKQNLAGALSGLALTMYRQNNIAAAIPLLQQSIISARESGDKWAIANSLENLGRLIFYQGDVNEARLLLEESVTLSRALEDRESLARALTTLVSIEIAQDHLAQATVLAQESYDLARALGTKPLVALALDSLGYVAMFQGEYEQATRLFEQRIKLAEELNDRATIALKRLTLGDIALAQKDFGQATICAQESLAFFRQQGDNPNIAAAFSLMGDIQQTQGDLAQAKRLYKEALQLDETVENKRKSFRRLIGLTGITTDQQPPG